ncbi:hypothetical protein SLA2020_385050 [Shorea laevis]
MKQTLTFHSRRKQLPISLFQLGHHGLQLPTIFSALLDPSPSSSLITLPDSILFHSHLDSRTSNTEEETANSNAEEATPANKPAEPPVADVEKPSSGVYSSASG